LLLLSSDRLLVAATMWDTRSHIAQQPLGFNFTSLLVVPAPVDPCRGHTIPCVESVGIVLSHLLFSGKTLAELIEHQIGVDGRDASDQDYQHPLHGFYLRSHPLTGNDEGTAKFRAETLRVYCSLGSPKPYRHEQSRSAGRRCSSWSSAAGKRHPAAPNLSGRLG